MSDAVLIGVGNPYRSDDGVGTTVARLLRERGVPQLRIVESFGEASELIDLWGGARLAVVVAAVRAHPARPGRVRRIAVPDPGPAGARAASTHGVDLGAAVALARALDRLPERLVLYAVEVAGVGYGQRLSPAVAAASVRVAAAAEVELARPR
jgi:hydrogenase maturation protease